MNWKLVVVGGLVFYIGLWIIAFPTGYLVHDLVLEEAYQETAEFWRPELIQEPQDLGALMPYWVTVGVITSLVFAALYGWVRSGFSGAAWKKGLQFGLLLAIVNGCAMAGWSGVFDLPGQIWIWWGAEGVVNYTVAGMVLGWVAAKVAPEPV